uniref:Secreted protein n=1 Tax=Achlya hypogyna TaxID=1202772 RepID=A0A0A7CNP3_ACHHY|nr:secreted protein [Achlya hypogyna]
MKFSLALLAPIVSLVAANDACGGQPTPTPTLAPTPAPTATLAPTPAPTAYTTIDCPFANGDWISLSDGGKLVVCVDAFWSNKIFSAFTCRDNWAFGVVKVGKKIALTDMTSFLMQCSGSTCPENHPETISMIGTTPADPSAQWACVDVGNGKWALQGNDGNFMTICPSCGPPTFRNNGEAVVSKPYTNDTTQHWTIKQPS